MSYLIVPISTSSAEKATCKAGHALASGAVLVEIRLDEFEPLDARFLGDLGQLPRGRWIATCRSRREGGGFGGDVRSWCRLLTECARLGAAYLDVEAWMLDSGQLQASELRELEAAFPDMGFIVSAHYWEGRPPDLAKRVAEMEQVLPGAVQKLAWKARSGLEVWTALQMMAAAPDRRMLIPMGSCGLAARVLAAKYSAFGTFCALEAGQETAPGQVTLAQARELYRLPSQTPSTAIFGVVGWPVGHSLSPLLFNTEFAGTGQDAVYVPLAIEREEELVTLLDSFRDDPGWGVRGLSITVPHKEAAFRWAGEGVEAGARRIGAVNTIRFSDARAEAFNTDRAGAVGALREHVPQLRDESVAVLGAGGAARAVVAGLVEEGARVTVFNRSTSRGERLARELGVTPAAWEDRVRFDGTVVVNCTSVGMHPHEEESPLPATALRPGMVVFDTIYNPLETRLLAEARAAGCQTICGVSMFVRQASCQCELWTDRTLDLPQATELISRALNNR